ncbi:DUF4292 domain-containing protein [Amniculibacterium aquaticum]|uniref:DUF4292 domain-containing protein n=1 Tax=Amniculibacterium aquaticum TaxID=2479858 RepID=UPI000F596793|nr:DUF4292 domain-containing protein [Amniculibacterium aquaticum]
MTKEIFKSNIIFQKKKIINLTCILFVGLFLLSCKTKTAVESSNNKDSLVVDSLLMDSIKLDKSSSLPKDANANLSINERVDFYEHALIHPKFEHLKMKSTIKIETGNSIPTLDALIYIENNQKIWMNLSFIVNAARGIATPEGIKAYEKYNRTYIDSDFDYLNNLLNIDFINYPTLQKLLMGRTFIPIRDSQYILSKNMEGYYMVSRKTQTIGSPTADRPSREYRVFLKYSDSFDLMEVELLDPVSGDELQINYENWQNFSNYRMPEYVKIIIKGSKTGQILIENTKFEDLKIQTPYSVPKNYTKIEIQ